MANVPAKLSHYSRAQYPLGAQSLFLPLHCRNQLWLLPGLSPSSSLLHALLVHHPCAGWGSTPTMQHMLLQRRTMSLLSHHQ